MSNCRTAALCVFGHFLLATVAAQGRGNMVVLLWPRNKSILDFIPFILFKTKKRGEKKNCTCASSSFHQSTVNLTSFRYFLSKTACKNRKKGGIILCLQLPYWVKRMWCLIWAVNLSWLWRIVETWQSLNRYDTTVVFPLFLHQWATAIKLSHIFFERMLSWNFFY